MSMNKAQEAAAKFLDDAGMFYPNDLDEDGEPNTLNMNDTWGWATAWGHKVPDDKLVEVAHLCREYGRCGVLYWFSCQHGNMRSEFEHINRFVDFVRNEERIRAEHLGSSAYAYHKESYTLGSAFLIELKSFVQSLRSNRKRPTASQVVAYAMDQDKKIEKLEAALLRARQELALWEHHCTGKHGSQVSCHVTAGIEPGECPECLKQSNA